MGIGQKPMGIDPKPVRMTAAEVLATLEAIDAGNSDARIVRVITAADGMPEIVSLRHSCAAVERGDLDQYVTADGAAHDL